MSKHTPGPWHVGQSSKRGHEVWARTSDTGSMMVAGCGHAEFDQANARLIAAAPELLEALEDAATYAQCGCGHPACKRCRDHAYYAGVIRKARGETP